jgi:hypothetical protein
MLCLIAETETRLDWLEITGRRGATESGVAMDARFR